MKIIKFGFAKMNAITECLSSFFIAFSIHAWCYLQVKSHHKQTKRASMDSISPEIRDHHFFLKFYPLKHKKQIAKGEFMKPTVSQKKQKNFCLQPHQFLELKDIRISK